MAFPKHNNNKKIRKYEYKMILYQSDQSLRRYIVFDFDFLDSGGSKTISGAYLK